MNTFMKLITPWKNKKGFDTGNYIAIGNYKVFLIQDDYIVLEQRDKDELLNHIVIDAASRTSFYIEDNIGNGLSTLVIQSKGERHRLCDTHDDNKALLRYLSSICLQSIANKKDRNEDRNESGAIYKYVSGFFKIVMFFAFLNFLSSTQQINSSIEKEEQLAPVSEIVPKKSETLTFFEANAATKNLKKDITSLSQELNQPNLPRADALLRGIQHQDYSVPLDAKQNDGRPKLFVFSDPLCPHCRSLEPVLARLSSDFQVHIFPVSVIGKDKSQQIVTDILCLKPQEREAAWKGFINGSKQASVNCSTGTVAMDNNNTFFRGQQLIGTPALIRADGAVFPSAVKDTTEQSLRTWLAGAK